MNKDYAAENASVGIVDEMIQKRTKDLRTNKEGNKMSNETLSKWSANEEMSLSSTESTNSKEELWVTIAE